MAAEPTTTSEEIPVVTEAETEVAPEVAAEVATEEVKDEKPAVVRTEGQTLKGVIKTWNVDKGFGFLECEDGGADIFIHQSVIKVGPERYRAVAPGTQVTCLFYLRDGKEAAKECSALDGGNLPGFLSKMDAKDRVRFAYKNPNMVQGTVKFMNTQKGFGFIAPDNGGSDVFVHIQDVEGKVMLESGEPVCYEVAANPDKPDKPQAKNVKPIARGGPPPDYYQGYGGYGGPPPGYGGYGGYDDYARGPPQRRPGANIENGKIKWFNADKGFGFIIPPTGADVYFKGVDIIGGGGPLMPDEPVSYETKTGEDGKVWAMAVSRTGPPRGKRPRDEGPPDWNANKRPAYGQEPYYPPAPAPAPAADPYGYQQPPPAAYQQPPAAAYQQPPPAQPPYY